MKTTAQLSDEFNELRQLWENCFYVHAIWRNPEHVTVDIVTDASNWPAWLFANEAQAYTDQFLEEQQ